MKKNMKVIFIIAVLFIICVGLYGVINENNKADSHSYNNRLADKDKTAQEDLKKDVNSQENDTATEEKTLENATTRENFEIEEDNIKSDTEKTEKEQYITRLDSIKTYYEDLWSKSGSDMTSMKELKNQEYTKWDDELNTIYQQIKKKLSEEEFVVIRDAERQWIIDRDEKATLAASKYAGGTMEGLEYMGAMTDITRERTYELVEIYFEE